MLHFLCYVFTDFSWLGYVFCKSFVTYIVNINLYGAVRLEIVFVVMYSAYNVSMTERGSHFFIVFVMITLVSFIQLG